MPTRILIVEDNPPTRRAISALLRMRGYQVHEAETVAGGLAGINNADTIILDLMLPDGSGDVILRLAKRLHPEIQVIITTAMHKDDYPDLSLADAVLAKPYAIEKLFELLEAANIPMSVGVR